MKIEHLLARRTDLSTFIVHLTRFKDNIEPIDRLLKIIKEKKINAESPFGMAVKKLHNKGLKDDSQKAVCFTETPLEYVDLLTEEIEGRDCQFRPYGIAITKKQARKNGVNPIWYLDITKGHNWLTNPLNELIDNALDSVDFSEHPISKISPFLEQMGTNDNGPEKYKKEFWWEREWRHVGDFLLPSRYIVLCPSDDIIKVREAVDSICVQNLDDPSRIKYIDPKWSLEMIIGKLAGFESEDIGPF